MCTVFLDALNEPLNINSNNLFFSSYLPALIFIKTTWSFFQSINNLVLLQADVTSA